MALCGILMPPPLASESACVGIGWQEEEPVIMPKPKNQWENKENMTNWQHFRSIFNHVRCQQLPDGHKAAVVPAPTRSFSVCVACCNERHPLQQHSQSTIESQKDHLATLFQHAPPSYRRLGHSLHASLRQQTCSQSGVAA
jgi:hypothetical protein